MLFLFGEGTAFANIIKSMNTILDFIGSSTLVSTTDNFDTGGYTNFHVIGDTPFADGVIIWRTAHAATLDVRAGTAVISGTADKGLGVALAYEGDLTPAVPLPASGILLNAGLGGLAALRRRV